MSKYIFNIFNFVFEYWVDLMWVPKITRTQSVSILLLLLLFYGVSQNTQSVSVLLLLCYCVWKRQNIADKINK